jgi:hypothetical protein
MAIRGPGGPKNPFTRYELPRKKGGGKATKLAVGEEGGSTK